MSRLLHLLHGCGFQPEPPYALGLFFLSGSGGGKTKTCPADKPLARLVSFGGTQFRLPGRLFLQRGRTFVRRMAVALRLMPSIGSTMEDLVKSGDKGTASFNGTPRHHSVPCLSLHSFQIANGTDDDWLTGIAIEIDQCERTLFEITQAMNGSQLGLAAGIAVVTGLYGKHKDKGDGKQLGEMQSQKARRGSNARGALCHKPLQSTLKPLSGVFCPTY